MGKLKLSRSSDNRPSPVSERMHKVLGGTLRLHCRLFPSVNPNQGLRNSTHFQNKKFPSDQKYGVIVTAAVEVT